MSFMRDFVGGFAEGFINGVARNANQSDRIEQLCHEVGWVIDERDGKMICLYFQNPHGALRKVRIHDGDCIVSFICSSDAVIPTRYVEGEILAWLLCRNLSDNNLGMWGMKVDEENDKVWFHLYYSALAAGLNAGVFKHICESMSGEANVFDQKMRQARLL